MVAKKSQKSQVIILILVLTNLVQVIFLMIISFHFNVPQRIFFRLGIIEGKLYEGTLIDRNLRNFNERIALFAVYFPKDYRIVMLGDSITAGVEWNELLGITSIANRGISGDTTNGFNERLFSVYSVNPEICFIMGGINDIRRGVEAESILTNIRRTVLKLYGMGIKPILQSTLHVSNERHYWETVNRIVDELNNGMKEFSMKKGLLFLDVNAVLSDGYSLRKEYTFDGLHLTGSGYKRWGKLLLELLETL